MGIVRETATKYFDINVEMERLALQDVNGSKYTVWRITTTSDVILTSELRPEERRRKREDTYSNVAPSPLASFESKMFGGICPAFKSLPSQPPSNPSSEILNVTPPRIPTIHSIKRPTPKRPPSVDTSSYDMRWADPGVQFGLSVQQLCEIVFPLHFGVNKELKIVQCGDELSQTIGFNPLGEHISLVAMNRSAGMFNTVSQLTLDVV